MKTLLFRLLIIISATGLTLLQAAPALTISPETVANDALATITYSVTGLSPGATVKVDRFVDRNGNGAIDEEEPLVRTFSVTDGIAPSIGGVRNKNVPGDDDGAQNGAIRIDLPFPGIDPLTGRMPGRFLIRASVGAQASPLRPFEVTQPNLPQRITGVVRNRSTGAIVPHPFIVLLEGSEGRLIQGGIADGNGAYTIFVPPGNYIVLAAEPQFVASSEAGSVTVAANEIVTKDILLTPATINVSIQVNDQVTSNPISSVPILWQQESGEDGEFLVAMAFLDESGHYRLGAIPGPYEISTHELAAQQLGYVSGPALHGTASAGPIIEIVPLPSATALIYGTVASAAGVPLPGIGIEAQLDNDSEEIEPESRTINASGEYFLGVVPSRWEVSPDALHLTPLRLRTYTQGVTVTANQAARLDFALQPTTAVVAGRVVDNLGAPISGVNFHGHFNDEGDGVGNNDTEPNGEFEIHVWGGEWRFHVGDDFSGMNLLESDLHLTIVDGQDQRNIEYVVLRTNRQITGSVRTPGAQGISGVAVHANATINGKQYQASGDTDPSGNFSLGVVDGNWSIFVDCFDLQEQGHSCPNSLTRVVNGGNQTADFIVAPPQVDAHLRGRATDQTGNPLANLGINAYTGSGPSRQTTTDQNGDFDLGVSAGSWTLEVNGQPPVGKISPSLHYNVQLGVDINNINFQLRDATHQITGSLRNTSGQGIGGIILFAGTTFDGMGYLARGQTDGNGNYTIPVFNGEWQRWMDCQEVEEQGYNCPSLETVTVQGANVARDIVAFTPVAHVRGRVTGEAGMGLGFASVKLTSNSISENRMTDVNGYFDFGLQATGPLELMVDNLPANRLSPRLNFNVTQGVDIENANLPVIALDGQLFVRMRDAQGVPVQSVQIYGEATFEGLAYRTRQGTTDGLGNVPLPAAYGSWRLHFNCESLANRGYACPANVIYEYAPGDDGLTVTLSPVPQGASLSNLQYTGGPNATFRFRVTGTPGTYDVYESSTLLDGSWQTSGIAATINAGESFRDVLLPVSANRMFYGVRRR